MSEPQWMIAGGHDRLVVWRVDGTGVPVYAEGTVDTAGVRAMEYAAPVERRVTGAGRLRDVVRSHRLAPEVSAWPAIARLRAWEGENVRAVVVKLGRGRNILWGESVPVRLEPREDGRGTLSADVLTLESHAAAAAVTEDPDLLTASAWVPVDADPEADDRATVVLPAPGLEVYAWVPDDGHPLGIDLSAVLLVEALDAAGAVLASDEDRAPTLRLPVGTWRVRVTAPDGVRPLLTAYPVAALVGAGGYILTAEDAVSATLEGFGRGTVEDGPTELVVWATAYGGPPGEVFAVETVALGDAETVLARTRPGPEPGTTTIDTIEI